LKKLEFKRIISSIIDPNEFIKYLLKHDLSTHKNRNDYELIITSMCHTSCEWATKLLSKNIHKDILNNLYWCVGDYTILKDDLLFVSEHSWIEYRTNSQTIVIDLTISQFNNSFQKLHIDYKSTNYSTAKVSASCGSKSSLKNFTKLICMV
jgi:hypothetical protein